MNHHTRMREIGIELPIFIIGQEKIQAGIVDKTYVTRWFIFIKQKPPCFFAKRNNNKKLT